MNRLSKEQKKIIYIGLILAAAILLFIALIYLPQQRRLKEIRAELDRTEQQINEIHLLTAGRDLNEAIRDLNVRLKDLSAYFLIGEEELINNLTDQARDLNIDVRDLDPGNKTLFNSATPGYAVYALPVAMNIKGGYKEAGDYCARLEGDFPALVRIDKLDIRGKGTGEADLDIRLVITAFLLKEQ